MELLDIPVIIRQRLLYGLSKLEYRGMIQRDWQSVTVTEKQILLRRSRLKVLADKTNDGESVPGTCGISHTRWATHENRPN